MLLLGEILLFNLVMICISNHQTNNRPVIGILQQPNIWIDATGEEKYFFNNRVEDYISSGYVKFIQSGGGLAIPIKWDADENYLANIMKQINGLLFPGGMLSIDIDYKNKGFTYNKYTQTTEYLLQAAIKQNDEGNPFPIFGICQGLQQLIYSFSKFKKVIVPVSGLWRTEKSLFYISNDNILFSELPQPILQFIKEYDKIVFTNQLGTLKSKFEEIPELFINLKITSTVLDSNGEEVVASIEGIKYPIFGTQFHPEKYQFEQNYYDNFDEKLIQMAQNFENKFIRFARQNQNKFDTFEGLRDNKLLIENHELKLTLGAGNPFLSVYFISKEVNKKEKKKHQRKHQKKITKTYLTNQNSFII